MAKEEATKKNIKKAQKENQNRINEQKAKERGKKAITEEITKKDKAVFEKEMKKIQMKEGWEKIKSGINNNDNVNNAAFNEQKEKQKKEKLNKMFEEEFF